jgi:two-component system LytT family response regulator
MLKAIIIDDEPRARSILETLVKENCPNIELVGQADDVPSGVLAIKKHLPDLVFLDIEMPVFDGFRLFEFVDDPRFEVIFTTAYNDYAIRAFEVSAIDYLLKPIQIDKLQNAIAKVIKLRGISGGSQLKQRNEVLLQNMKQQGVVSKIALPVSDGLMFVSVDEIIYLMADGSYTNIYLSNGTKLLVTRYLKDFVELIDHPQFYKPHRSYYINLNHIRQYVKTDGGHVVMSNGDTVNIARDSKDEFLTLVQDKLR